ncbi:MULTISPECIES: sugar transferase [unclassified Enterococcus]|jgi:lipopolysaccharide/colanic/teichoic acid biosynthesis glycosyltransferase|uniref:sugar transferase n=1 Tax=unclassified Enterococcus TaxID=2608891 RepID=UPI003D2806F7
MKNKYCLIKYPVDILFSLITLIVFIPLWIIIILAVKIDDPHGPVIFKQRRMGKDGKPFIMYKFRSMVVNAEEKLKELEELNEQKGPLFKIKEDPRVTRVGHFLRRTSLDEFPQLVNVIKGDMSLIGPRPPLEKEVFQYTEYQKKRLQVKPGCTGLWQVSGRSNVDFEKMLQLDVEYIEHYNILMDAKIFFKTFKVLFTGEGSY